MTKRCQSRPMGGECEEKAEWTVNISRYRHEPDCIHVCSYHAEQVRQFLPELTVMAIVHEQEIL